MKGINPFKKFAAQKFFKARPGQKKGGGGPDPLDPTPSISPYCDRKNRMHT